MCASLQAKWWRFVAKLRNTMSAPRSSWKAANNFPANSPCSRLCRRAWTWNSAATSALASFAPGRADLRTRRKEHQRCLPRFRRMWSRNKTECRLYQPLPQLFKRIMCPAPIHSVIAQRDERRTQHGVDEKRSAYRVQKEIPRVNLYLAPNAGV